MTGAGEESAHAVAAVGPGRPLFADGSYASGRGGVAARRAPRFTEMRDDCPDWYRAEGYLCRQRSRRRKLSTASMTVKERVPPVEESSHLEVENHQLTGSIPGVSRYDP